MRKRLHQSAEYLFAVWEGGGNVPPALEAARRMAARGHHVRLMADPCVEDEARAAGLEFVPWTSAPSRRRRGERAEYMRDWDGCTAEVGFARLAEGLMCGPAGAFAADVLAELERRPADVIVSSEMLFGVMIAAERAGLPLAILTANVSLFPVPGVPPFGPGFFPPRTEEDRRVQAQAAADYRSMFNALLGRLNEARTTLGLAPLGDVFEQLDVAERVLLGTSAAFDFDSTGLPPGTRYVGPMLEDPTWVTPWSSPWPASSTEPLVAVAFSTTYQAQCRTVQRTMEALRRLPVRGLVTLGPAIDRERFEVPPNVVVCASAPHSRVFEEASVVVTHGGHGTVVRGLVAGAPLLVIPMGRDQNDNAARVVARGAGLMLASDASSDRIHDALRTLLDEPRYRRDAAALGHALRADAAASPLVDELESLVPRRMRAA